MAKFILIVVVAFILGFVGSDMVQTFAENNSLCWSAPECENP